MASMHIGIVGMGTVGSALAHGFNKLGHRVSVHDKKLATSIRDVLDADIVYVCVETPSAEDGACDTTAVHSVADELAASGFAGIVALKSTVTPGTTAGLQRKHPQCRFAHVPEFLRERAAVSDFVDNHDVCIVGVDSEEDFAHIKESHGSLPEAFRHVTPTEAELAKYFGNVYNAMLITFANNFYEICRKVGADYATIKDSMVLRRHIHDKYLTCNQNLRGFGGACLPKDTRAIASLSKELGLDVRMFDAILSDNANYLGNCADRP